MANGACSADRGTKGGGGWYCASVKLQIRPRRESAVSSNSSPLHAGLRQKKDALGKNTVPQVVHRLPSSAGSSPVVNQPSIAGVRGRPVVVSDTPSDYSRPVLERWADGADRSCRPRGVRHPAAGPGTEQVLRRAVGARRRPGRGCGRCAGRGPQWLLLRRRLRPRRHPGRPGAADECRVVGHRRDAVLACRTDDTDTPAVQRVQPDLPPPARHGEVVRDPRSHLWWPGDPGRRRRPRREGVRRSRRRLRCTWPADRRGVARPRRRTHGRRHRRHAARAASRADAPAPVLGWWCRTGRRPPRREVGGRLASAGHAVGPDAGPRRPLPARARRRDRRHRRDHRVALRRKAILGRQPPVRRRVSRGDRRLAARMVEGRGQPPAGALPEPRRQRAGRPGRGLRHRGRPAVVGALGTVIGVPAGDAPTIDRAVLAERVAAFDRRSAPLEGRKAAAVAVVVIGDPEPGDDTGVILTKRAARMRAHAGQWALPGGRIDADETAQAAALRELDEELGLRLDHTTVLGPLDDYPTRSGYRITPVVMWLDGGLGDLSPNPQEVASVHVATWDMLAVQPIFLTIPESDRPVIQLPMLGTKIHAPTAAVLYQFRELALHGRTTRMDGLEQPTWAWR